MALMAAVGYRARSAIFSVAYIVRPSLMPEIGLAVA